MNPLIALLKRQIFIYESSKFLAVYLIRVCIKKCRRAEIVCVILALGLLALVVRAHFSVQYCVRRNHCTFSSCAIAVVVAKKGCC